MLDQMEKPSHVKGDRYCQYCDNYLPRAHYPARHRFRVVPAIGAQRIRCPGFIHCEAIPNDSGGITIKWTCDACSYTQTEELFEEIEATHTLAPFAAGERIITQTMLDDAGHPPAPGESIAETALAESYTGHSDALLIIPDDQPGSRGWLDVVIANRGLLCGNCGQWRLLVKQPLEPNRDPHIIETCPHCGDEAFDIFDVPNPQVP
jgi:hypothetical protein